MGLHESYPPGSSAGDSEGTEEWPGINAVLECAVGIGIEKSNKTTPDSPSSIRAPSSPHFCDGSRQFELLRVIDFRKILF